MRVAVVILTLWAMPATAETLVAARTLRAQTILSPGDLMVAAGTVPGTATDPAEVIGLETRVAIYQGRPIRPADLGPRLRSSTETSWSRSAIRRARSISPPKAARSGVAASATVSA